MSAAATPAPAPGAGPASGEAWTISRLSAEIQRVLAGRFPDLWVEGEISNLSRSSAGHVYFTLKDERAQLRAVLWKGDAARIRFDLADGLSVYAYGTIDVYAARGQYQFVARKLVPKGIGPLELAFRQLYAKLAAEGLFRPERKRPIPRLPKRIALVTSPRGAAIRDFLEVALRRWPGLDVVLCPAAVQGDAAPAELRRALAAAARIENVEVVALVRGGGSLEDLWAFNDEGLARAIAESPIPIVSGVGHEVDVTIADLVADLRALTPSEAAERIFPDRAALLAGLERLGRSLGTAAAARLFAARRRWERIGESLPFRRPLSAVMEQRRRLDEQEARLAAGSAELLKHGARRLDQAARSLEALSPLAILGRGYAIAERADGRVLRTIQDVAAGDAVLVRLADGRIVCDVKEAARNGE